VNDRLTIWTGRALSELPDRSEVDMLVGPLVVRGARTIIVGDTGHGKTTLAAQLAAGVLTGAEVLGYTGAGVGPIVVVDLEQGLRSLQRTAREVGFDKRDDVLYVHAPDGLSLDSNELDRNELEDVIAQNRPAVLILDPYYKAHRGDSNEERAVVDLMRYLDRLRSLYGFAVILPAHPRKDPGSSGARRLTLHDVAGSGAAVRGAEVVIAIERLSHGYARLRILKDRDGDLPVGDAWPLLFSRGDGFRLDPKEERSNDELEQRIASDKTGEWRTVREWGVELGIREKRAKTLLEQLAESGVVESALGPPGRSARAQCYRTAPKAQAQSGAVTQSVGDGGYCATAPDSLLETSGSGRSPTPDDPTGAVGDNGKTPHPELKRILTAHISGHITTGEALELERIHRLVTEADAA
jgi:archaellum biogenesis ATPase FlaH